MSSSSPRAPELGQETRLYFPVGTMGPGSYEPWRLSELSLAEFCLDTDGQREHYLAQKRSIVQRVGRGPLRTQDTASQRAQLQAADFLRARMLELLLQGGVVRKMLARM